MSPVTPTVSGGRYLLGKWNLIYRPDYPLILRLVLLANAYYSAIKFSCLYRLG